MRRINLSERIEFLLSRGRLGLNPIAHDELSTEPEHGARIRRSRLLIADFTGGRAGVYWEAGFARGLGLPVIYTCHKSMLGKFVSDDDADIVEATWKSRLHFDTTQFPHIFWSSPEELMGRVLKRIRANGWDLTRKTPAF